MTKSVTELLFSFIISNNSLIAKPLGRETKQILKRRKKNLSVHNREIGASKTLNPPCVYISEMCVCMAQFDLAFFSFFSPNIMKVDVQKRENFFLNFLKN